MNLKSNIVANYISQMYVTLAGIIVVPIYIHYMGHEAYGLVGFFVTLQVWFGLMDMGLTPTLIRETTRFRGQSLDVSAFSNMVGALELIFLIVGGLGGGLLFLSARDISIFWLHADHLDSMAIVHSVQLMAVSIPMRWMSTLYRAIPTGAEEFVWLGAFNALIATARIFGVIPVFLWLGGEPQVFFGFQCIVALVELLILLRKARQCVPISIESGNREMPCKSILFMLRHSAEFSAGISFASFVWVVVTQVDKLMLSKLLPLGDYGVFTLSALAASGVGIIAGPISGAVLPRLVALHAQGYELELTLLYKKLTRTVVVIVMPASYLLAMYSERVLRAWTGDQIIADQGAVVLSLYAISNGIMAVAAFPYYLQYAQGQLRFHVIGSGLFLSLFVPLLLVLAQSYGAVGAGYAWLITNIAYFLLWTPIIHERFSRGYHIRWLIDDVLAPSKNGALALLAFSFVMLNAEVWPTERIATLIVIFAAGIVAVTIGFLSQTYFRNITRNWLSKVCIAIQKGGR